MYDIEDGAKDEAGGDDSMKKWVAKLFASIR